MTLRSYKPKPICVLVLLSAAALTQTVLAQTAQDQTAPAQTSKDQTTQDQTKDPSVTYTPINPPTTTGKAPSVTIAPVPLVTAQRASQTMVELNFRVASGFHINSNTPKSEFLIPTALKMDLPTDIALGKIAYPAGQDLTFPFSPDETLNVYSGDFAITVAVHPLKSVVPGKYVMHGMLRYQACDNAQCFPPKTLPVSFEVKVVKEPPTQRAYPAQSPRQ